MPSVRDPRAAKRSSGPRRSRKDSPGDAPSLDKTPVDDDSMRNDTIYKDETELHKTGSGGSAHAKVGDPRALDASNRQPNTDR